MGITLTVYFEGPHWVGLFEREDEDGYAVARVVYGAEPSAAEVYEQLRRYRLLRFTRVGEAAPPRRPRSRKRAQREAARAVERGPGTRAQQAVQAARAVGAEAKEERARERRREEAERRWRDRVERRKARHRGR